jgi:hypothetical protein
MHARGHAAVAALSLAASFGCGCGCGGGARGELCGQTQPCGGDVVGSWTVSHSCLSAGVAVAGVEDVLGGACKALTIDSVKTEHEGTITFAADLTFTAGLSARGTVVVRLPSSCVGGLTCAQLGTEFMTQGLSEVGCTGASSCTCPIPRPPLAVPEGGTYLAADATLSLQLASGTEVTRRYCVVGSTLHMFVVSGDDVIDDVMLTRVPDSGA